MSAPTEPRNNEVQRFELAKEFALRLLEHPLEVPLPVIAARAVCLADELLDMLATPKEAK